MGKAKTQRTDELRQAIDKHVIAEVVSNRIEEHNFDRLVNQGILVEGGLSAKVPKPPEGRGLL